MSKGNKRLRLAGLGLILLGLWGMLALLLGNSVGMETGYRANFLSGSGETPRTQHPQANGKRPANCVGENCAGMEEVVNTALLYIPLEAGPDDATSAIGPRRGAADSSPGFTSAESGNAFPNETPGSQFAGIAGFGGPGIGNPGGSSNSPQGSGNPAGFSPPFFSFFPGGGPANTDGPQIASNAPGDGLPLDLGHPPFDVPSGGSSGNSKPPVDCVPLNDQSSDLQASAEKLDCGTDSNGNQNSGGNQGSNGNANGDQNSGGSQGSNGNFNGDQNSGGLQIVVNPTPPLDLNLPPFSDPPGGGTGGLGGSGAPGGGGGPDGPTTAALDDPPVELPEPVTFALFAAGLAGAFGLRRRSG